MNRMFLPLWLLSALNVATPVAAQDFYPDFALVVQLPSYETFLTNLGDSPISVDHYEITSESGSLSPPGWASLDSAGPEIVTELGPGADQFDAVAAISPSLLVELNLLGSATWQPGQSWSIGFPFDSDDPEFVLDPVFRFSTTGGFILPGGTEILPDDLGRGAFLVIPELPGDFNGDGSVDAADYVVWRKTGGTQAGYDAWRANFGRTLASGEGSVQLPAPLVPEPASAALAAAAMVAIRVAKRPMRIRARSHFRLLWRVPRVACPPVPKLHCWTSQQWHPTCDTAI
jgi:hypothetical protein